MTRWMMSNDKYGHALANKDFLKRNEFAEVVVQGKSFIATYKGPVSFLVLVALFILLGIPVFNYYRDSQTMAFSEKFYKAGKGLKKEDAFQSLVRDFSALPAARLAHLELAEYHLSHGDITKAHAAVDQGLAQKQNDVLTTLLVLKKIDLLRADKKTKEAASFAASSEARVLPAFKGRLKLLQAELLVAVGERDVAKGLYDQLSKAAVQDDTQTKDGIVSYTPDVIEEAKEQLLLIKLGLL